MVQKNSWKTRGFPNEAGSVGEKVGKKWLENKGYRVYFFQDIMGMFADLHNTTLSMSKRRKREYKERDRKIIQEIEKSLMSVLGQKIELMKKIDKSIRQVAKNEKEARLAQGVRKRRSFGFDYIAIKDNAIFFIDVKVNQAELGKYQRLSSKIVKEHGFNAMVLRLNVGIEIGKSIQFIEPKKVCG
jgi:hypothetical protein